MTVPEEPHHRQASVLVVDDERALTEVMSTALAARGFRVRVAVDGREALDAVSVEPPDIVLLDLGLPDIDGMVVCRELRTWFANPIIILSADGAEDRKVEALDVGADDYVTKPFSMPELLARVRVALRHRQLVAAVMDDAVIELGDLTIDLGAHVAAIRSEPIVLTRKEFAILAILGRNVGRVLRHQTLFDQVWGRESASPGTQGSLRVHVTNLRRKLGDQPNGPRIVTEPGVGYRLVMDEDDGA